MRPRGSYLSSKRALETFSSVGRSKFSFELFNIRIQTSAYLKNAKKVQLDTMFLWRQFWQEWQDIEEFYSHSRNLARILFKNVFFETSNQKIPATDILTSTSLTLLSWWPKSWSYDTLTLVSLLVGLSLLSKVIYLTLWKSQLRLEAYFLSLDLKSTKNNEMNQPKAIFQIYSISIWVLYFSFLSSS